MLCTVCRNGLEGIWDPSKTQRLGHRSSFEGSEHSYFRFLRETQNADKATLLGEEKNIPEVERFIYGHHVSKESLEQSRREGCVACSNMDDGNSESLDRFGHLTTFTVEFHDEADGTKFEMSINHDNGHSEKVAFAPYPRTLFSGKRRSSAVATANRSLEGRMQFLHRNLTNSTEDPATWDVVKWWLSTCLATHEACAVTSKSNSVPTRLLKLNAANNTFRLVSRNDVEPASRYAALSHCWGPESWASHLILNGDNYAALCTPQLVDILPKTFRDAFTIIRRLNIQYLWIDRFCIFQDSKEDWQKEASMMHYVYRNSFVCISALSSANDDGGCFFARDIEAVKPSILNMSSDGASQPKLYTSYRNDSNAWQRGFGQEVLTSRAWVLQERLLAPRSIHFGKSQVYWECNQEFRSETQPEHEWRRAEATLGSDFDVSELRTAWKALIWESAPRETDPVTALGDEWLNILHFYSSCKLTKPEDKLVAISAIVKDMKRHLEGLGEPTDYLAGIWGLWLPQSLLWSIRPETAGKHRPRQYHAPSWSWASVESTVFTALGGHLYSNQGRVASVVSTEVRHLTDDDTGQVVGGALTLRGTLVRVLLEESPGDLERRYVVGAWAVKGFETVQGDSLECGFQDEGAFSRPRIIFDSEEDVCHPVLFLPVHVVILRADLVFYRGLLLDGLRSDYRRVGFMDIRMYSVFKGVKEFDVRII